MKEGSSVAVFCGSGYIDCHNCLASRKTQDFIFVYEFR